MNDNQSATIRITRPLGYFYGGRKFNVFINGAKSGTISNGKEAIFSVPAGKHTVYIQIDFYKSRELPVDLSQGELVTLNCTVGSVFSVYSPNYIQLNYDNSLLISSQHPLSQPNISSQKPIVRWQEGVERVPAATEDVQIPTGVTVKVKRSRTVEHSINLEFGKSNEGKVEIGLQNFLSGSIRSEISQKRGITQENSETIEYEIELSGDKSNRYRLTWVDIWSKGIVEFSDGQSTQMLPFRFREKTELMVSPISE